MIQDDSKGNLVAYQDIPSAGITSGSKVGDIIYPHGILIVSDTLTAEALFQSSSFDMEWNSNVPIYTTTYFCKVKDYEYNLTLNPSALDINGNLKNNLTGSEFTPYITSVGLYNDAQELIAVAKLGRPVPKSDSTDMVFKINLDI